MAQSAFASLKNKQFLPLFLAQFLGAFNDNAFKNALVMLLAYKAAGKVSVDPRILVTASAGIFILPFFLFSATAGQLADKFSKARLIQIVKFTEIPIVLLATLGFALENYWMLLGVLFCAGVHAAFFGPLKYSILPDLLQKDQLVSANALVEAGTFLAILLGTMIGGILVMRDGGMAAISVLLIAVAAAGWIASLRLTPSVPAAPDLKIGLNFLADTGRVVKQTASNKTALISILGISWFWLVGFTFLAQFPVYASITLGANEEVVTLFLTLFSVGIALGSLICSKILKGRITGAYIPLGLAGMTAGIVLLWLASQSVVPHVGLWDLAQFLAHIQNWFIVASLLIVAIFGGIFIVPLYTIMQTSGDPTRRSRTVAANNIVNAAFMVLGAILTIVLTKAHVAMADIFLILGAANIVVAFLLRGVVKPFEITEKR